MVIVSGEANIRIHRNVKGKRPFTAPRTKSAEDKEFAENAKERYFGLRITIYE